MTRTRRIRWIVLSVAALVALGLGVFGESYASRTSQAAMEEKWRLYEAARLRQVEDLQKSFTEVQSDLSRGATSALSVGFRRLDRGMLPPALQEAWSSLQNGPWIGRIWVDTSDVYIRSRDDANVFFVGNRDQVMPLLADGFARGIWSFLNRANVGWLPKAPDGEVTFGLSQAAIERIQRGARRFYLTRTFGFGFLGSMSFVITLVTTILLTGRSARGVSQKFTS